MVRPAADSGRSKADAEGGFPAFSGIFVGVGSNLGDRSENVASGLAAMAAAECIRVCRCSTFHETDPIGGPSGQTRYVNAVVQIETTLDPITLLQRMLEIEAQHGRTREIPNGPRTLDLDLLTYNDQVSNSSELTLPHPRLGARGFVVEPLREIAAAAALTALHSFLVALGRDVSAFENVQAKRGPRDRC